MHSLQALGHETESVFIPEGWKFMIQSRVSRGWIIRTFPQRSLRLGGEPGFLEATITETIDRDTMDTRFKTTMIYDIREMAIDDYEQVYRLWRQTEGLSLDESDSREGMSLYLRRNPAVCFVATVAGELVGTVLCGHEGRRGILLHLAVRKDFRGRLIARCLLNRCLSGLAKEGIKKCNTFVDDTNVEGLRFWEHMGWYKLEDNYRTMQSLTARPPTSL